MRMSKLEIGLFSVVIASLILNCIMTYVVIIKTRETESLTRNVIGNLDDVKKDIRLYSQ